MMQATADVLAMASLEVDLSKIEVGQTITVKWRGKPVFIRHRSEDEISSANSVNLSTLRDPQKDEDRVTNPEVCNSGSPAVWPLLGPVIVASAACPSGPRPSQSQEPAGLHAKQGGFDLTPCAVRSGWSSSACARTWAACHCRAQETLGAGSAPATAATTTCLAAHARALRPPTWRFPSTSSWMTTPSWSARSLCSCRTVAVSSLQVRCVGRQQRYAWLD